MHTFLLSAFLLSISADASTVVLEYDAQKGAFSATGPQQISIGEILQVQVTGETIMQRRWFVDVNYEKPVKESLQPFLAALPLKPPAAIYAFAPTDSPRANALQSAVVAMSRTADYLTAQIIKTISWPPRVEGFETELREAKRLYEIVSATYSHVVTEAVVLSKLPDSFPEKARYSSISAEIEKAVKHATDVIDQANKTFNGINTAHGSLTQKISIKPGFSVMTVRMCEQRLVVANRANVQQIEWTELTCQPEKYSVSVSNPLGMLQISATVVFPIAANRRVYWVSNNRLKASSERDPVSSPIGAVFVGPRWPRTSGSGVTAGPEVGFAVGEKAGRVYALGGQLASYGLGVGVGVYLDSKGNRLKRKDVTTGSAEDRTRDAALLAPYLRIGLSSDVWDYLK